MQNIEAEVFEKPFPHLILYNFYDERELDLIWEELNFYTKPDKLLEAKDYLGVVDRTNAKALALDMVYTKKYRSLSNILTVTRKIFEPQVLKPFSQVHECCCQAEKCNYDYTKVRYYHDGDFYKPHTDNIFHFLAFSYFYREPKRFEGGELIFPKYNYTFSCDNNSVILMPAWVEHGVNKVTIKDSDYFDGYGRYAITSFFGNKQTDK
tara:strand:- start:72 stop:695 length:624 start_codon:yes stop_codon:yes gene_type:complete